MRDDLDPESAAALARLDRYRLERDLTFEDLAAEMTAADLPIKARTLQHAIRDQTVAPRDRTCFKIREFVARQITAATERTA